MIEYGSYSCFPCSEFSKKVFPKIVAEYISKNKVFFIFRHVAMDKTTLAAEILSTCYTSGKYQKTKNKRNPWAFHELMFETAKNWYHKKQYLSILSDITKNFGMSTEEFDKCIEDVNIKKFVLDANLEHMRKQNINSTPTFIIKYPDGKLERIEGFKHYAFFEKKFNDALKVA